MLSRLANSRPTSKSRPALPRSQHNAKTPTPGRSSEGLIAGYLSEITNLGGRRLGRPASSEASTGRHAVWSCAVVEGLTLVDYELRRMILSRQSLFFLQGFPATSWFSYRER